MDDQIGIVLGKLEDMGVAEDTLVIYSSDQVMRTLRLTICKPLPSFIIRYICICTHLLNSYIGLLSG